jgi:hypothetical protein
MRPLRYPGFPVEMGGIGELHAVPARRDRIWSFYISEGVDRSKSAECASFLAVTALMLCIRARL